MHYRVSLSRASLSFLAFNLYFLQFFFMLCWFSTFWGRLSPAWCFHIYISDTAHTHTHPQRHTHGSGTYVLRLLEVLGNN